MFTGYVINLSRHIERLYQFNQHPDAKYFKRIDAVDKKILSLLPTQFYFDHIAIEQEIKRPITLGEMGCTLSHILAWQDFAESSTSSPYHYAVIAEDDIQLIPNFSEKILTILHYLEAHSSPFNIVLLHKLGLYQQYNSRDEHNTQYTIQPIEGKIHTDNDGSALYLIKKSHAQFLIQTLSTQKPNWLADHFSTFSPAHIGLIQPFLGQISSLCSSDLEQEREQARKIILNN